jgi:hypothetical protein
MTVRLSALVAAAFAASAFAYPLASFAGSLSGS